MFIISVLVEQTVEAKSVLPGHFSFLKKYFEAGIFIMYGPYQPLTGGFIIAQTESRAVLDKILAEDTLQGIAEYHIQECIAAEIAQNITDYKSQ